MKKSFTGSAITLAALLLTEFFVIKLGHLGVNADLPPPSWEARLLPMALHASVARHAGQEKNPVSPTEENLKAGISTYKQMCARCHSLPGEAPSIYGASFYPPAPQLSGGLPQYTDAELFWIIKHGIRNTGMPAWGRMLSDEDIWQIVAVLKGLDNPPAVDAQWKGTGHKANKGEWPILVHRICSASISLMNATVA